MSCSMSVPFFSFEGFPVFEFVDCPKTHHFGIRGR